MTLDADMMFGYRCANNWFDWDQGEVAGSLVANFLLAGYSGKYVRGYAIRVSQG